MNIRLARQSYGKHQVHISRVLKSNDEPSVHRFIQVAVDVVLEGDFDVAYTEGDNGPVIATDTCKNIVHNVALEHPMDSPESLGLSLTKFFLDRYEHVDQVTASMRQTLWSSMGGCPHAFTANDRSVPQATVVARRGQNDQVTSGIGDFIIAKTTESGFSNFHNDEYRTLADTEDRILATSLSADWTYRSLPVEFSAARDSIMAAMMAAFVDHFSRSVQETLMRMGQAACSACSDIERIKLVMPNKHHIPIDMSPFGRENHNDLFVVSPEPFGYIEAEIVAG